MIEMALFLGIAISGALFGYLSDSTEPDPASAHDLLFVGSLGPERAAEDTVSK